MMRSIGLLTALTLLLVGVGQAKAGPITFDFQFDNQGPGEPDGIVTPPFVGSGTFTINNDPGPGTFTLACSATAGDGGRGEVSRQGIPPEITVHGSRVTSVQRGTEVRVIAGAWASA
jgi:hypothetical protein